MSVRWQCYRNLIQNFSFENENETITGLGSLWDKVGTPTLSISSLYKKHNLYSQKIIGDASGEGVSQTIDISDIVSANFGLIFYTYIVSGELNVKIETLDGNGDVYATVFNKTYSSNSAIIKQSELFSADGQTFPGLKITFSYVAESGISALTCYLDSVLIFENVDTEIEINPTNFNYTKVSDSQFIKTIEGENVKISPLEESKRTHLEGFSPVWSWITVAQRAIFDTWVGKDLVIIDHNDDIYWMDFLRMSINYIEKQVPDKYAITMEFQECIR